MIHIIIPVRNRENSRIQTCIDYVNKSIKDKKIIVVDYSSDKKVKVKDAEIYRIDGMPEWNKCHAINLAVKKYNPEYIMTLDCDILITREIGKQIEENLGDCLIIDTNVRRIQIEKVSTTNSMVSKSTPYHADDKSQFFNQANGGFQVYTKEFFDLVGGLPESLGYIWGGHDNWVYYVARMRRLKIIDLSVPLFHMEHPSTIEAEKKDKTPEEKEMIDAWRGYKSEYLNYIIKYGISYNPERYIARKKPCLDLFYKFKKEFDNRMKTVQKAIKKGEKEVNICFQKFKLQKEKPSIFIAVMNNQNTLPQYFVWDLINLYNYTKQFYPNVVVQQIDACDISLMRNLAIRQSLGENDLGKRYDYVVLLDSDHHYPMDFLAKFVSRMEEDKIPVLTGLTATRKEGFTNSQYYKIIKNINKPSNCVDGTKENKLVKIESSGPVGMVIHTKVFNKIDFPYFESSYKIDEKKKEYLATGEDIFFSKKLKKARIPIYVDKNISFPHEFITFIDRGTIFDNKSIRKEMNKRAK
jgi:cellulose synthase/poly-beta-1,6-N-acetylglucosamine synthase-like glycosyltransferase